MSPKPNKRAPHLTWSKTKSGKTYYYYRMPNGKKEALGSDLQQAIEAANALTSVVRKSGGIVQRVLDIHHQHTQYDPRNPPMSQVIAEFKETIIDSDKDQGKIAIRTYEDKTYILNTYTETLSKTLCQSVTTYDLAELIKEKSGNVQRKHIPMLQKLFRYAISQGYMQNNPANELEPKQLESKIRLRHSWEGLMTVRNHSPEWMQRTIDIALYSLQRRGDLVELKIDDHINKENRSIKILQQKTRNYKQPIFIEIAAGNSLWSAIDAAITSDIPCPYLVHCRPKRMTAQARKRKAHPFAVTAEYITRTFKQYRDSSGAYEHMTQEERPTFHDIRAIGILMYHKAGYSIDYIMALAGHAKEGTTQHYIGGHEEIKPVRVEAGLSIEQVDIDNIDWKNQNIPLEISKLVKTSES